MFACLPTQSIEHVVYVHSEGEWLPATALWAASSSEGPVWNGAQHTTILPTQSRSEIVVRAALEQDGVHFLVVAAASEAWPQAPIRAFAVEHAADEQVLAVEDALVLVSNAVLPRSATTTEGVDVLPQLARQDGEALSRARIVLAPPANADGLRWIALGPGGSPCAAREAMNTSRSETGMSSFGLTERDALALSVVGEPVRLEVTNWDQVFCARSRPIESSEMRALTVLKTRDASVRTTSPRGHAQSHATWPSVERVGPDTSWNVVDANKGDARLTAQQEVAAGRAVEVLFENPPATAAGRAWTILLGVGEPKRAPVAGKDQGGWPRAEADAVPGRTGAFVDVAHDVGIDMVHFEGPDLQLDIRPTMGPGAAWGDVDGDGWVDLFLPQGGGREGSEPPKSRFFRNVEGKRFVDESASRGLALTGAGMGALFYDADGDGDLDLFVANYGRNRFLVNDGTGKFSDASGAVGLDSDLWHAAVSAADYDQDGDLDLYVTSYLRYDTSAMPSDEELGRYQREDPVEMLPYAFPGERKLLLRCDAARTTEAAAGTTPLAIRYTDAAKELGLDDPAGRGMQALWWDFDRDGDQDLVLANDVSPNRFWRNEGGGKFKDVGFSTGLDDPRGCMGFSAGDVDGDLDEDLFVTNWQLETNALYVNNLRHTSAKSRVSTFRDRAVEAGVAAPSVGVTGWGCELADFDDDGDLDLFYANGYTSPDYESTGICVGQPCHYLENDGTGKFTPAFEKAGPDVAMPLASRAAVACDYDQDGDLDIAVTANNGRFRLLRNEAPRGKNHWLGIRLKGADGNTRAIGSQVVVEAGERKLLRSMRAGTGYLSGNAPELHFGLGEATSVTSCTVRWPSGKETTHAIEGVDRFVTIAEPR